MFSTGPEGTPSMLAFARIYERIMNFILSKKEDSHSMHLSTSTGMNT
jgi:hypothetical protein